MRLLAGDPFYGQVNPPAAIKQFADNAKGPGGGLVILLNNLLRLMIVGAGFYALVNFILAGYQFFSAAGDSQKVSQAWAKIWQTLLGLVVVAASFLLAALVGLLLFGKPTMFLQLKIWTAP